MVNNVSSSLFNKFDNQNLNQSLELDSVHPPQNKTKILKTLPETYYYTYLTDKKATTKV